LRGDDRLHLHPLLKGYLSVKNVFALLAVFCGIGVSSGCAVAQEPAAPQSAPRYSSNESAERILNLDDLKKELKEYYACTCKCGCYRKDLEAQADRAIAFLQERAGSKKADEKLALVLDIDETTLSNYEEMIKADFAYDAKAFAEWVNSGKAPALPATLRLYHNAQDLGVSVFFITGRSEDQRDATARNLRTQGFQNWQDLVLRSPEQAHLTAVEYKSAARGAIEAHGYKIVLNVGDQWSDLTGKPEAEFSVKYPDPYYYIP
jgi:acid phosphatase